MCSRIARAAIKLLGKWSATSAGNDAGSANTSKYEIEAVHTNPAIAQVQQHYWAILSKETAAALQHRSNPYWSSGGHNIGDDELCAIEYARNISLTPDSIENGNPALYGIRLLRKLESTKESYIASQRDPEGFGIATLCTIAREMNMICRDMDLV